MHEKFMKAALVEAKKALKKDEVPVGAVAVKNNKIIARGHNTRQWGKDTTAHAEITCLRKACKKIGDWRLEEISLYVTLEPCAMCAGAIINSRIKELVWGTDDEKFGACGGKIDIISKGKLGKKPKIVKGILVAECKKILQDFFVKLRNKKKI